MKFSNINITTKLGFSKGIKFPVTTQVQHVGTMPRILTTFSGLHGEKRSEMRCIQIIPHLNRRRFIYKYLWLRDWRRLTPT